MTLNDLDQIPPTNLTKDPVKLGDDGNPLIPLAGMLLLFGWAVVTFRSKSKGPVRLSG